MQQQRRKMAHAVVDWRRLEPDVVASIRVQGTLTLTHSKACRASATFAEHTPVPDALSRLTSLVQGREAWNPKITGYVKLCQHVTVNGMRLGPLLGETVSRQLNGAKPRGWISIFDH